MRFFKILLFVFTVTCYADSNTLINNKVDIQGKSSQAYPLANYVEIDPQAFQSNLKEIRKVIGPKVKLCVVMKSDAYGHGINNLLDEVVKSDAEYIAAVDNSEFRAIVNYHPSREIHLLRIAPVTKAELIEALTNNWHVEEIAGSPEEAQMISDTAKNLSKRLGRKIVVQVHINIETGMGRMGFRNIDDMKKVFKLDNIQVVGVMTHFARDYEESPNDYIYTRQQFDMYESAIKQLPLQPGTIRHVANSAGATKFPWSRLDMVRVGSLVYGEDLDDKQDPKHVLKPVMPTFKSTVVIVEHDVPPNSPVNYDAMGHTRSNKKSTTATLRIGYNYGFPQYAFQESMQVIIRGQKFPVLGKTSMNMLVVDITDQDPKNQVKLGDEAFLVGKQGKVSITWEEFAKKNKMGTTEQVLLVGNQSPRKLLQK